MISTRLIALLALAASLPLSKSEMLDVWSPAITDPNSNTIWYGGSQVTVSWDVSKAPANVTNPTGIIYLVANGLIQFQDELAWDFELAAGKVDFYVPDVLTGVYQVVLIGDSGNFSDNFTIIHQ